MKYPIHGHDISLAIAEKQSHPRSIHLLSTEHPPLSSMFFPFQVSLGGLGGFQPATFDDTGENDTIVWDKTA